VWNLETRKQSEGNIVKVKVKVTLQTGHEGPESEQRYSYNLSSALDGGGGELSTSRPGRNTPPRGKKDPEHIV